MLPYFKERFGNPHSRTHAYGWEAEDAVEDARAVITFLFRPTSTLLTFVLENRKVDWSRRERNYFHKVWLFSNFFVLTVASGATESNNLAIKGVSNFYKSTKKHIITVQTVAISIFVNAVDTTPGAQVCPRFVPLPARARFRHHISCSG